MNGRVSALSCGALEKLYYTLLLLGKRAFGRAGATSSLERSDGLSSSRHVFYPRREAGEPAGVTALLPARPEEAARSLCHWSSAGSGPHPPRAESTTASSIRRCSARHASA
ncbi:hypothetical protein HPB47_026187 [Ixodes persulcatus]|uniref:Uncharacterized protein n=1 Tax=Ixodes persulcatus TaxID=34615 RepID=A0AC60Q187_IXOPE|nr:hypothetical protein HPB47_026187 [Ixodes persulcatus]